MFVRGAPPIWFEFNLTGQIFDTTYYAFFLTNDLPYVPQPVFMDPNGINAWSNPIEFQPNGGLADNIYGDPDLVYRIEFREGPDQTYPLIGNPIQNYIFGAGSGSATVTSFQNSINQILNSQFAFISFANNSTHPYTITVAGTYNIAPGWTLVLTGTGTTTVQQIANPGSNNVSGNPPYYLELNNSGWSSAQLIQTISGNGAIFNNGSIAMSALVRPSSLQTLSLAYIPSGTSNPTAITGPTPEPAGVWSTLAGAINVVSPSLNANTGTNAYVQLIINLQGTGTIDVTNVQFSGQDVLLPVSPAPTSQIPLYQETTPEQQQNGLFNVYSGSIIMQPKDTILTGWSFGLNPWQFRSTAAANVATNTYVADQTIVIQQNYVSSATGNNISAGQASYAFNQGFQVTAVGAHNNFALIQFVDFSTTAPYWGNLLSSLVTASLVTSHSSTVRFKMRLIARTTTPSTVVSQTYPIASWVEGQDPVFNASFTAYAPQNDPVYTLSDLNQQFALNGFNLPAATTNTMMLGIVIYTIDNMNSAATADAIVFNDVSLVPNAFAIASNPKTSDAVLRECQFYYEKSYELGMLPGAIDAHSEILRPLNFYYDSGGSDYIAYASSFDVEYNTKKRQVPNLALYNPVSGNAAEVEVYFYDNNSGTAGLDVSAAVALSNWALLQKGTRNFSYVLGAAGTSGFLTSTASVTLPSAHILFHYVADARICIV